MLDTSKIVHFGESETDVATFLESPSNIAPHYHAHDKKAPKLRSKYVSFNN